MSILDELDRPFGLVDQHRLALSRIIEDPDQPRVNFDAEKLAEMAASIKERGVLLPILVQPPDGDGYYRIIDGARRYRASKLAGLKDIPVTMREERSGYDQMIANIQRDDLRASEIAVWIGERLAAGDKQADIARLLGKSRNWVSVHAQYGEFPVALQRRTDDLGMKLAVELFKAFKQDRQLTLAFLADNVSITQGDARVFREALAAPGDDDAEAPRGEDASPAAITTPQAVGLSLIEENIVPYGGPLQIDPEPVDERTGLRQPVSAARSPGTDREDSHAQVEEGFEPLDAGTASRRPCVRLRITETVSGRAGFIFLRLSDENYAVCFNGEEEATPIPIAELTLTGVELSI